MMTTPRFVPMLGDSMVPTIKHGDLVAVLPAASYCGDGLYVIDVLGVPSVVRAGVDEFGRLTVCYDNPHYNGARPMAQDVFEGKLLCCVLAVCSVLNVAAMVDAGMLAGWDQDGKLQLDGEGA